MGARLNVLENLLHIALSHLITSVILAVMHLFFSFEYYRMYIWVYIYA